MPKEKKKAPSNKVILQMEGLPEPWVAVQHTGKENQIYYYNKLTKEALWTQDWERRYGRKRLEEGSYGRRKGERPEETFDGEEPMEVDVFDHELKEYRSQGVGHLQAQESVSFPSLGYQSEMQLVPTVSPVIAVLDTSVLINTKNFIKQTAAASVHIRIPYTTIQELDGLKQSERLRSLVNAALSQMETLRDEQPDLISFESSADRVSQLQLRASSGQCTVFKVTVNDDYIIKTGLRAKQFVSPDQSVVLVSNDYNMRVKAGADGLKAVGATEFLSNLVTSPRSKKNVHAEGKKKDKKALGLHGVHHANFKPRTRDALNQTHPPPTQNKKKKKQKPSMNTTIGPSHEPTSSTYRPPNRTPAVVPQTGPFNASPILRRALPSQPPSTPLPWHRRPYPVAREVPDTEKPWVFQSEILRFQYILKQATETAIDKLERKTEDFEAVSAGIQELAKAILKFFEKYDQDKFREAIRLTEELYQIVIGRLTTFQHMNVDRLEGEVRTAGADCELINAMHQYIHYLRSKGWNPPV